MKKHLCKKSLFLLFGFGLMAGNAFANYTYTPPVCVDEACVNATNFSATYDYQQNVYITADSPTVSGSINLDSYSGGSLWDINSGDTINYATLTFYLYDDLTSDPSSSNMEQAKVTINAVVSSFAQVGDNVNNYPSGVFEVSGTEDDSKGYEFYISSFSVGSHVVNYSITSTLGKASWNSYVGDFYLDKVVVAGCYTAAPVNPVPEPTTMLLLGTGVLGLAFANRKKNDSRLGPIETPRH